MMRVLVTGATGFIGSNLVNRLIDQGYEVSVLVRSKRNKILSHKVTQIRGDLTISSSLKKIAKNKDIIFHLAAGLPHHHLSDEQYWAVNVKGLVNLLENCVGENIKRFVHISTVGIYGPTSQKGVNESSKLKLTDTYSITKFKAEETARRFLKEKGLPITIIRPTIGYGPGDTRPGFISLFKLIKKKLFIPIGSGKNFFHTIYVDNLVDALILAATKKEAIGEDFIIGDEPCPTMGQIIREIALVQNTSIPPFYIPDNVARFLGKFFDLSGALGLPAPLNSRRVKFMIENKRFSIDKAKKILGYKPKVSLKEGIGRTYRWYRDNGYI